MCERSSVPMWYNCVCVIAFVWMISAEAEEGETLNRENNCWPNFFCWSFLSSAREKKTRFRWCFVFSVANSLNCCQVERIKSSTEHGPVKQPSKWNGYKRTQFGGNQFSLMIKVFAICARCVVVVVVDAIVSRGTGTSDSGNVICILFAHCTKHIRSFVVAGCLRLLRLSLLLLSASSLRSGFCRATTLMGLRSFRNKVYTQQSCDELQIEF